VKKLTDKEILFLADPKNMHTKKLLQEMKSYYNGKTFSILNGGKYFKDDKIIYERKNYTSRNKFLKFIETNKLINKIKSENIELIHIHFLSPSYFFYKKLFKNTKVIITFWGSDLYRIPTSSRLKKYLQKQVIKQADIITVVQEKMVKDFHEIFGFENKPIYVTRFGSPIDFMLIDKIDEKKEKEFKEKYKVPEDDIVLTLGYSSDPNKNHEYMINEIMILNKNKKNLFIFIPMTYGNNEHREKIKKYCQEILQKNNIRYVILQDYMNDQEVAILRKITDIMVNVQDTDAFSASMQESLYAGGIVINGSWLNYDELSKKGAYYETISELKPGALSSKIEYIIDNLKELKEKAKINKEIIRNINDFDMREEWVKVYNKVLEA